MNLLQLLAAGLLMGGGAAPVSTVLAHTTVSANDSGASFNAHDSGSTFDGGRA